jgi:hypothetical protein
MLAKELDRPGLVVSPSKVLAVMDGAPRSALEDPTASAPQIIDKLKLGIEHWINGRHESAESQLDVALYQARHNPALVVSDPTLRQLIPRAHVARAVSLLRLRRTEQAKLAMAELVRTLPEQSILDSWGTEAEKIFQLARKELEAQGKGTLVVDVDDPATIFYLNEAGQPHRSMLSAALYPGRYRILVQDASGESRRYEITVSPNETTMLRLDWRRELEFSVSGEHVGFTFKTAAERVREGDYARHFASLVRGQLIVVVGLVRWRKHLAMIGTIYRVDSDEPHRIGVVPLTGDQTQALHDLAAFLFSPSTPAPSVTQLRSLPWEPRTADAQELIELRYPMGWVLSAGAVAAGAVMVAVDRDSAPRVSAGYTLLGFGLLGGITTSVFYLRRSGAGPKPTTAMMLTPAHNGLFAGLSASF